MITPPTLLQTMALLYLYLYSEVNESEALGWVTRLWQKLDESRVGGKLRVSQERTLEERPFQIAGAAERKPRAPNEMLQRVTERRLAEVDKLLLLHSELICECCLRAPPQQYCRPILALRSKITQKGNNNFSVALGNGCCPVQLLSTFVSHTRTHAHTDRSILRLIQCVSKKPDRYN